MLAHKDAVSQNLTAGGRGARLKKQVLTRKLSMGSIGGQFRKQNQLKPIYCLLHAYLYKHLHAVGT